MGLPAMRIPLKVYRLGQWLRRPLDELSRWYDRWYVLRTFPGDLGSAVRIYFELQALARTGRRPSHWPLKVYAPLIMSDQRVEWKSLTDSLQPGRPKFGRRWVHPQELMETTNRFPAYYAARFDKDCAKFVRKYKTPDPLDAFSSQSGGFA